MDDWKMENIFGKRIRLLRESKGLTQRSLLPYGVKQSYLANLEAGLRTTPSSGTIVNLAKGLGVTAEDLVAGTDLEYIYTASELPIRAYCPNNVCPKLRLNQIDTGMLIPYRFSTERSQASKDKVYEAKFCPYCGTKLLVACPACKKPILIEDPQQIHCMLCGKRIFEKLTDAQIRSVKGQI